MQVHTIEVRMKADGARMEAKQLDRQMGKLDKRAGGLGKTFAKMGALIGAVGFGVAARDMFQTIVATETMKASLETMTGSMENANAAFEALQEFASTTPFTVDQSVQAFIKMKALGLEPTAEALTSFGNTASAMGKDMNQMIEAVADAATMEFERLKEFGIKARQTQDDVSFTFQGVTTTVGKNAAEIVGYLEGIGEVQFAGAMERQMARLPGKLSNLRDNVQKLWRVVGDAGVTKVFARVVDFVSAKIDGLTEKIKTGFLQAMALIQLDAFVEPFKAAFKIIGESWGSTTEGMIFSFRQMVKEVVGKQLPQLVAGLEGLPRSFSDLLGEGLAILPLTISKTFEAMFEKADATFTAIGDQSEILKLSFAKAWLGIQDAAADAWDFLHLGAAKLIDSIIMQFHSMAAGISSALRGIGLETLADKADAAASALFNMANAEDSVRLAIAQRSDVYDTALRALDDQIDALKAHQKAVIATADANIDAILSEVAARLTAIQVQKAQLKLQLDAEAAANAGGESFEDILNRLAKAQDDLGGAINPTTKEIEKQAKAFASLAQKLQPYIDKMRGVSDLERLHANNLLLVEEALRRGVIGLEDYDAMLAALDEGLKETGSAHDNMVAAVEDGIERMGNAFVDMWGDFLQNGTLSMDGIKSAFEAMLAEMVHAATTRPIMLQLQNAANGEDVDFKALGQGVLQGVAIYGGSLLGGGGQGAATGAALGSLASLIPGFGPIAGVIGSIIGGVIGGLFDRDPRISVSGGQIFGGNGGTTEQTAFGDFVTSNGAGGVNDFAIQLRRQVREFDQAIADFLTPEQITEVEDRLRVWSLTLRDGQVNLQNVLESRFAAILTTFDADVQTFVGHATNLEDQVKRLALAMGAIDLIEKNQDVFQGRGLKEFLQLAEVAQEKGEELATTMERLATAMAAAFLATEVLAEYSANNLPEAYQTAVDLVNQTLRDQLIKAGENVSRIIAEYDDTASTVEELANAVRSRYELEIAMLFQLDAIAEAVSGRFTRLIETISEFIDPKTIDDHVANLDDLFLQLSTAVDPTEVDRITAEIERVARLAWNSLPDDMKASMGEQFIEMLREADSLAQERLALIREQVVAESALLREQIDILMKGISDPMGLVINDLGLAAALLIQAGDALLPGGRPGLPGGPGGRDPFDPLQPPGKGPVYDPDRVIGAVNTAAVTLQNEGAAYRSAQASMTAQLAKAIASIPDRIVVEVRPGDGEFA